MFPIIFIIIAAVFIFRTARENGYNPFLWTILAVVGFLAVQVITGFLLGILVVLGSSLFGWSPTLLEDNSFLLGIAALVPAIGIVWLIWRHVNKIVDDGTLAQSPPPPPTFD